MVSEKAKTPKEIAEEYMTNNTPEVRRYLQRLVKKLSKRVEQSRAVPPLEERVKMAFGEGEKKSAMIIKGYIVRENNKIYVTGEGVREADRGRYLR